MLQKRELDLFEQVVLGLCQSGIRSPTRIGAVVGLDPRLCAHILDKAESAGHLDKRRELTPSGRRALQTGAITTTPEWRVFYVFQDPFISEPWPRIVDRLTDAHVVESKNNEVTLQLGSAGRGDRIRVAKVLPDDRAQNRPSVSQVLAAASVDRADRRVAKVREFERGQGLEPAAVPVAVLGSRGPGALGDEDPLLHRVSFVEDAEPVFIVGFVEVVDIEDEAARSEGWLAHDPFGVGHSAMFRSLLQHHAPEEDRVVDAIQERVEARVVEVRDRYNEAENEMRSALEVQMVNRFGADIRDDHITFDLLMDLELAKARGDRDDAIEKVAQASWRLFESLFRRMLRAYPVSDSIVAGLPKSILLSRATMEEAARRAGFPAAVGFVTHSQKKLSETNNDVDHGLGKELAALCLLAAGSDVHGEHPFHRISTDRPDLLGALPMLNNLRNRGAHGERDAAGTYDAEWCYELAMLAVRELLLLPTHSHGRISG